MSIFDRDSEYKMVILMRQDLKMSKGKTVAQACHAAVACSFAAKKKVPSKFAAWDSNGSKTVALKVDSERDLFEFKAIAEAQGMVCSIICDAGRTEIAPGSYTCLAIGPEKQSDLDKITGDLKML